MRQAQKSYFKARREHRDATAELQLSKQLEKEVDERIKMHQMVEKVKKEGDLFSGTNE